MAELGWEIVAVFGILCGMLAIWTEHKEKMAMIAKGLMPKRKSPSIEPTVGLLVGGSVLLGIGMAVFIGSFWAAEVGWPLKLGGLVPAFIGIALISSYLVLRLKK